MMGAAVRGDAWGAGRPRPRMDKPVETGWGWFARAGRGCGSCTTAEAVACERARPPKRPGLAGALSAFGHQEFHRGGAKVAEGGDGAVLLGVLGASVVILISQDGPRAHGDCVMSPFNLKELHHRDTEVTERGKGAVLLCVLCVSVVIPSSRVSPDAPCAAAGPTRTMAMARG